MTYPNVGPSDDIIGHIDYNLNDGHDGELKWGDFAKENTKGDEDSGGAEVGTHQAHQVEVDVRPGALAVPPLNTGVL